FVKADLAIFDEAHNLNAQICEQYEFTIPFRLIDGAVPAQGDEFAWLCHKYRPNTEALLEAEISALENAQNSVEAKEAEKQITRLSTLLSNIDTLLSCDARDWVVTRNAHSLRFQPIWAHKFALKLFEFLSPRRIFMSSTFLDQTVHLQTLGL